MGGNWKYEFLCSQSVWFCSLLGGKQCMQNLKPIRLYLEVAQGPYLAGSSIPSVFARLHTEYYPLLDGVSCLSTPNVFQMLVGTLKMLKTSYRAAIRHPEWTVIGLLVLHVGHWYLQEVCHLGQPNRWSLDDMLLFYVFEWSMISPVIYVFIQEVGVDFNLIYEK